MLDPLAALVTVDVIDTAEAQFIMSACAKLAGRLGCVVLICHHMTKGHAKTGIANSDVARDAIKGNTQLVDGGRFAFVIWPADEIEAKVVCRKLERPFDMGIVYKGAVAKINMPSSYGTRTLVRGQNGLLVDMTETLKTTHLSKAALEALMVERVADAAEKGKPFTQTGEQGVFKQKARLGDDLKEMTKRELEALVQKLLNEGRIVKCAHGTEKVQKWLDVPDGPFANNVGEFTGGAGD